ncbi:MAG: lysine-2,3-aminomutase-like protein [Actinomycetota bacterium]
MPMTTDPARRTLRTAAELAAAGLVAAGDVAAVAAAGERHAVALTPAVVDLIDPADPADPNAPPYVPPAAELGGAPDDPPDPHGDQAYSPLKGVVHRYPDRVLIKPALVCPVYCRFCFRREAVGDASATLSEAELAAALDYVAARPELREVILTGGDPLMLGPARMQALLGRLAAIGHIETVRIHTRVPVADPERVTAALVAALRAGGPTVWLAVHVNHPRELSPAAAQALARLADAGLPLVSQTVLLKGVNDDADTLAQLMRALLRHRVKPYYLHHPDLAPGTAHFRPTLAEGRALVAALRGRLSGLAQPTYVLDIPGGAGKVPVGPDHWDQDGGRVTDWTGVRHPYP